MYFEQAKKLVRCGFDGQDIAEIFSLSYEQVRYMFRKRGYNIKDFAISEYVCIESLSYETITEIIDLIAEGYSVYDISIMYNINIKQFIAEFGDRIINSKYDMSGIS